MRSLVLLTLAIVGTAACGSGGGGAAAGSSDSQTGDLGMDTAGDAATADSVAGDGLASDSAGSDTGKAPTLTKDILAFCDPWAAMACKRALGCSCTTPKEGPLTDKACPPYMLATCLDEMQSATAMMAEGLLLLDADKAKECVASLDAALPVCSASAKGGLRPGPCREMLVQIPGPVYACFTGSLPCADGSGCDGEKCGVIRQPNGSACSQDGQCQSLSCDVAAKTCAGVASLGGPCSSNNQCPLASACVGGVCAEAKIAGATCAGGDDIPCGIGLVCTAGKCAAMPKTCTGPDQCGTANACLGAVTNQCAPRLGAGKTCTQDGECQSDLWCDSATKLCTARPGIGSPCANGVLCAPGAVCQDGTQTCVAMPGEGQACGMGEFGPFLCGPGLVCKTDAFVCSKPPSAGAPCSNHANCSPSAGKDKDALVCQFGPNGSQCVAKQPIGAKCENDICQEGAFCSFQTGACAAIYAAGTPCKDGNECGPQGSCVPDKTGTLRCAPMPGAGQDCLFECQDGLYCSKGMSAATCQPPICSLFYKLK